MRVPDGSVLVRAALRREANLLYRLTIELVYDGGLVARSSKRAHRARIMLPRLKEMSNERRHPIRIKADRRERWNPSTEVIVPLEVVSAVKNPPEQCVLRCDSEIV